MVKKASLVILGLFLLFSGVFAGESKDVQYLAIFIDGQKVGYAIHSRTGEKGIVRTTDQMELEIMRFGMPIRVATTETSIETIKGKPVGFESVQDMSAMKTIMKGTIASDGKVSVTSQTGQFTQTKNFDWPKGAVMAEGLYLLSKKKGLKSGTAYSVKLFSPSLLQAIDMSIKVEEKEKVNLLGRLTELTRVLSKATIPMAGLVETISYVGQDGNALKTVMPLMNMKLEMIDCDKEFAFSENSQSEIAVQATTPSPRPLKDLDKAKWATYKIRPDEGAENFDIPQSDNQSVRKLSDGTLVIKVTPREMPTGAVFPYQGDNKDALAALVPNQYVQSDDERIIAAAKKAVGNTKDAGVAVKRIEKFAAEHIENRTLSVGYGSAAEVFETRQGDCTEFAVLTAAMCQAVGIPSRVVTGLAYVDEFMGMQNVFGGHAWTEAYVGDKWIGLDAAFTASGRGGYHPGHIALSFGSGEISDAFNLIFTIGRFKIVEAVVENLELRSQNVESIANDKLRMTGDG